MIHPKRPAPARASLPSLAVIGLCAVALSACNMAQGERAEINDETKFSQKEYKVAASPRVTDKKKVRKGGGRYIVGKPYQVRGKWYHPAEDPGYSAVGMASWYGPNFHGRLTANGEIFDQYALTAAHPTMPLPSYARVTNLDNGSSMIVRVNDRGPFAHGRVIDLSARAARMLGYDKDGVANVKVDYVGKARVDGLDEKFLLASYRTPGTPEIVPGATQPGTLLAMNEDAGSVPASQKLEDRIQLALASEIPVPTERPVTYEGLPIAVAGDQPFMTASVMPLGYAGEQRRNRRIDDAFSLVERMPDHQPMTRSGPAEGADEAVFIRLGRFTEATHAEMVRQRFADLGMISMRRMVVAGQSAWEVRLMTAADVADDLMRVMRDRGLDRAERIGG
ncbi:MAG: septal ring lytic transglycosylase RlpA family protein [Pseudomonadota bacterium]|nr:septal ring lytic transglycosylase RlpA family protein [Pseudomonadota bacterium]